MVRFEKYYICLFHFVFYVFDVRSCVMMSCVKVGESDQGDVLHMLGSTLIYSKFNAVLMPLLRRLLLHIKQ